MYRLTLFITFPESQTSDIQIISCKPSDTYMCTNGDLVQLAGYGATTTPAGPDRPGGWCQLSRFGSLALHSVKRGRWPCGFWRHMFFLTCLPCCFRHCFMTTKKAAQELTALSRKSDSVKAETRAGISQKQLLTVLSWWDCGCIFKPWSRHNAAQ